MKKKELQELRKKDIKDLHKLLEEKRKQVLLSYAEIKAGQEKDTRKTTNLRHEVAQILTILKESEIVQEVKPEKEDKKENK